MFAKTHYYSYFLKTKHRIFSLLTIREETKSSRNSNRFWMVQMAFFMSGMHIAFWAVIVLCLWEVVHFSTKITVIQTSVTIKLITHMAHKLGVVETFQTVIHVVSWNTLPSHSIWLHSQQCQKVAVPLVTRRGRCCFERPSLSWLHPLEQDLRMQWRSAWMWVSDDSKPWGCLLFKDAHRPVYANTNNKLHWSPNIYA